MRITVFLLCLLLIISAVNVNASVVDKRKQIAYDDKGNRDPFKPLIGKDVSLKQVTYLKSVDDLVLEGILVDPKKGSVVIVNGQVLREGNSIGGFHIDTILNSKVIFSREGKKYTVTYGEVSQGADDPQAYKSMFTDVAEDEF